MDKSKVKGLAVAVPIVIIAIFAVGEEKKFEEQRESEKNMIEEAKQVTDTESSEISQESSAQTTTNKNCDSSYPDVCIPSLPPDLDCSEITQSNFRVLQPDQHGFDQDKDGIGCEK